MRSTDENRFPFSAWGISLGMHGVAVGLALAFAAQVKPILKEEIFKWDVALVQSIDSEPTIERAEPLVKPAQPTAQVTPTPSAELTSDMTMSRVAAQQSVQMVHPVIEPAKPIEQKVEPPPQMETEPVEQRLAPPQPTRIEPIEQNVVEVAKPKAEPVAPAVVEARDPEPAQHAEPVIAQSQVVAVAGSAEPVEAQQPYHAELATHASAAPPLHETQFADAAPAPMSQKESHHSSAHEAVNAPPTTVPSPAVSPSPSPDVTEAPVQMAKATPSGSEVKMDHRWIAESLGRRLAELKRYPSSARVNGWEGKVILRAVIRSDGHLAEVSVFKSSGHPVLDAAAMETVKLACPLHMKHDIGRPQIVVNVPMVYSLAN